MSNHDHNPSPNILSLIRCDHFRITQKNEFGQVLKLSCNSDHFEIQQLKQQNNELLLSMSVLKRVATGLESEITTVKQTLSYSSQDITRLTQMMSDFIREHNASKPKKNVTMRRDTDFNTDFIFNSIFRRSDITSITVVDSLQNAPFDAVDISENRDGSIKVWCPANLRAKELFIGSDDIICLNSDSSSLFRNYTHLITADLSKLDTSNVTNMRCMFSGCFSLTTLIFSGWNTSNVTDMAGMFSGCSSLTTLELSSCYYHLDMSIKNRGSLQRFTIEIGRLFSFFYRNQMEHFPSDLCIF